MQRVVNFYGKLPRGPAPEPQANGLLGWYQKKYFGKNPSAARKLYQGHEGWITVRETDLAHSYRTRYRIPRYHRICSELLLPLEYGHLELRYHPVTDMAPGHHKNNAH